MKQKIANKTKTIQKLASDIKELLHLDECEPVLMSGQAWLRLTSGEESLDIPIGTKPLYDKKNDNTPAIKAAVIRVWLAHLENEQRMIAEAVMRG